MSLTCISKNEGKGESDEGAVILPSDYTQAMYIETLSWEECHKRDFYV